MTPSISTAMTPPRGCEPPFSDVTDKENRWVQNDAYLQSAGPIRLVDAFRDDALELVFAGELEKVGARAVSYATLTSTNFTKIIGIGGIPVKGLASATTSLQTYSNYYVLIDTSESMGIGSTATDMQNLYNATASSTDGGSCVFGCHGHYYSNDHTLDHEAVGITLRIDSARTAVQSMIGQAQNTPGNTGNIKIGLYTMTLNGTNGPYINKIVDPPSSNYSGLSSAATAIDLPLFINNNSNNPGWTDANDAITQLANLIPASGNGLSPSTPINYAFIVSDGLQDMVGSCDVDGHCTGPISLIACQALQAHATVGKIYTTYLPIYNGNNQTLDHRFHRSTPMSHAASSIL